MLEAGRNDGEIRQNLFSEKKDEYIRKSIKLKEEFVTAVIHMTNLSYSDKKRRIKSLHTVRDLYFFLMSEEATMLINPVLRNGILVTFEEEFANSNVFDDRLTEENYAGNILTATKYVERAVEIKNKLTLG